MAAVSQQVLEHGVSKFPLAAPAGSRTVWQCGDIVQHNGMAHVLPQLQEMKQGDVVAGHYTGTFEIDCASATTAALNADAFYHEANRLVVTASGAGIIAPGKFAKAKLAGETKAVILLNHK